jgi:hypothetical protein
MSEHLETGSAIQRETPQVSEMTLINPLKQVCGAKTRQGGRCREVPAEGKKRCRIHGGAEGSGAPAGERNGKFKHGRYSAETRAQRNADAARRRIASDEWQKQIPTWDWHATCAEIERSARNKPRADKVRVI